MVKLPTSTDYWISEFPFLHDNNFSEIYKIKKSVTEVRLQSFNYKLLNRIFPCNSNLYKWGIANSPLCLSCGIIDTIEHHLDYCHYVLQFWRSLEQWVNNVYEAYIPLKITDIIFGIVP